MIQRLTWIFARVPGAAGGVANILVGEPWGDNRPLSPNVRRAGEIVVSFTRAHFPKNIILTCMRWYVANPLSDRQLAAAFHGRKRPVSPRWRPDETHIRVCGHWRYLYRAVDKTG